MIEDLPFGEPVEKTGGANGAGAGAAGEGLTRPPLPGPLPDFGTGEDLYELHVGPPGKEIMILHEGTVLLHLKALHVIHKDDAVRVSHGNGGDGKGGMKDVQRLGDDLTCRLSGHGDFTPCKPGGTHLDPNLPDLAVIAGEELQGKDAGTGLGRNLLFRHDAVIIGVLGHAADAVAAHLRFGTVGIEHPHPDIRTLRRHDQDQPVGTDPEVAVGEPNGKLLRVSNRLPEAVDIDIIISRALHFGEFHKRLLGRLNLLHS